MLKKITTTEPRVLVIIVTLKSENKQTVQQLQPQSHQTPQTPSHWRKPLVLAFEFIWVEVKRKVGSSVCQMCTLVVKVEPIN